MLVNDIMLLCDSLKGIKSYEDMTWQELVHELRNNGIYVLGEGVYGMVFGHDSWNYVIKVFDDDDAYGSYVNFCISKNSANKCMPKFFSRIKKIHQFHKRSHETIDNKFMYVVKMERLNELPSDVKNVFDSKEFSNAMFIYNDMNSIDIEDDEKQKLQDWLSVFYKKYPNYNFEELLEFIQSYRRELMGTSHRLDVHGANVMLRKGTNDFVLIDPSYDIKSDAGKFKLKVESEFLAGPLYRVLKGIV